MKTKEKQESKSGLVEGVEGIAVCGSNFTTPVTNVGHVDDVYMNIVIQRNKDNKSASYVISVIQLKNSMKYPCVGRL